MCPSGNGWRVLKKHAAIWGISTEHFLPNGRPARPARPLAEWLVEGSVITSTRLKRRLYAAGLKTPVCELCGQGEEWQGRRMSLILDHVNGVRDDNRLENLRIVCPNCNATLDTHCGRGSRILREDRSCGICGQAFTPNFDAQRYCSRLCGSRSGLGQPRRVERPPVERLLAEIDAEGYVAVGRRYGVSDNAIRKWLRVEGIEPPGRRRGPAPRPVAVG